MKQLTKVTCNAAGMLKGVTGRVKEIKKLRNLTDLKLAQKMNYHEKSINRMLNSDKELPEDFILQLADALEVTPEYIRGESEFMTADEHEDHIFDKRFRLIVDLVNSLKHFDIQFKPHLYWCDCSVSEDEQLELLFSALEEEKKSFKEVELLEPEDFHLIKGGRGFRYYKLVEEIREKLPYCIYREYEYNHMDGSNIHLAHELIHNGKRRKLLTHKSFLHLMDQMNNNIASMAATMINTMSMYM